MNKPVDGNYKIKTIIFICKQESIPGLFGNVIFSNKDFRQQVIISFDKIDKN